MKAFEALVQRIIEREREYSLDIRIQKDASKIDEYKGAVIALRNVLVDASEIRHTSCQKDEK